MRPGNGSLLALLLLCLSSAQVFAAEFSARIVDGLGRPLAGAAVKVEWTTYDPQSESQQEGSLLELTSDGNGVVKGTYDEKSVPPDATFWINVSKEGYGGYGTPDRKAEYVLEREAGPADVRRIAALEGDAQVRELRELLAGDFELPAAGESLEEVVFAQEHRFRPALRALVPDPKIGMNAGHLLAFIGVPEDLRLILEHAPPPGQGSFDNRWAYGVAAALLEPTTEKEWAFLRSCVLNEYDDMWVIAGGIRTLGLIASPRSVQILKEAQKTAEPDLAEYVARAIKNIEAGAPSLSDENLEAAGKKAAQTIGIGEWQGNEEPRLNEKGDKALVPFKYRAGRDLLVYTATFHKVDGRWKLRGLRETMQALLAE